MVKHSSFQISKSNSLCIQFTYEKILHYKEYYAQFFSFDFEKSDREKGHKKNAPHIFFLHSFLILLEEKKKNFLCLKSFQFSFQMKDHLYQINKKCQIKCRNF